MPVIWKGPTNALVLQPNSPKLTYGDRVKAVDIYKGPQSLCAASMLPRGTFGTGFRTGWVVTQSEVVTDRGYIGTLNIEWEAGGAYASQPLPVGTFDLTPQELYPKIERNPFFAGIKIETINWCRNAMDQAIQGNAQNVTSITLPTQITDAQQLAFAQKLIAKWAIGEDTYYLAGWKYSYETFSYTEPTPAIGGVSVANPGGPANLPAGLAWIRLASVVKPVGVNGSMYVTTNNFLGGPNGYWDSDIYPAGS